MAEKGCAVERWEGEVAATGTVFSSECAIFARFLSTEGGPPSAISDRCCNRFALVVPKTSDRSLRADAWEVATILAEEGLEGSEASWRFRFPLEEELAVAWDLSAGIVSSGLGFGIPAAARLVTWVDPPSWGETGTSSEGSMKGTSVGTLSISPRESGSTNGPGISILFQPKAPRAKTSVAKSSHSVVPQ